MTDWADTLGCRSGFVCRQCRDSSPAGVGWRLHMSKTTQIPEVCPFGVPIDAKAGKARAPVSLTVGGRPCCGGKVEPDTFTVTRSE